MEIRCVSLESPLDPSTFVGRAPQEVWSLLLASTVWIETEFRRACSLGVKRIAGRMLQASAAVPFLLLGRDISKQLERDYRTACKNVRQSL